MNIPNGDGSPAAASEVVAPVVTPGSPEYDAAMAAKGSTVPIQAVSADGKSVTQVTAPVVPEVVPPVVPEVPRPEWLPASFKTEAEFKEWYATTEKGKQADPAPTVPPVVDPTKPPEEAATPATQKFFDEFAKTGAISEASYGELAKLGLDKSVVDSYIAGQQAQAEVRTQAGYAAVGGEAQFKQMTQWAAANLSPQEIAAFNSQVNSNQDVAMMAVKGLAARFTTATGSSPKGLLNGGASAATTSAGYQSKAQVTEAMSNPKYESDSAYRNSVIERLKLTDNSVI